MPDLDYLAGFFGIFGEKCCLPSKEMGFSSFDKPEKVDIKIVDVPITGLPLFRQRVTISFFYL
jgi:hypothetical protein